MFVASSPRVVPYVDRGIVLLVHGFGSSSGCWAPLVALLGSDERITSRYELRTWDYVVGHESHRSEAPAAEIGRGEDTGEFYQFDFTPEYGQEYCRLKPLSSLNDTGCDFTQIEKPGPASIAVSGV